MSRLVRALLRIVMPADEAARLADELDEVRRARAARQGPVRARIRHAREVVAVMARMMIEPARETGGMGDLARDARLAARSLRRSPGFTAVAALTLALGIGATTTVYGVVDAVLVRSLPYPEAERLVAAWPEGMLGGELALARERARSFEILAGYRPPGGVTVVTAGEGARLQAASVTPELFRVLGVRPRLGRALVAGDADPGAPRVAVLSHALWTERFGADPSVVGSTLSVEGEPATVAGVLPEGLAFPSAGTDLWLPLVLDPANPGQLWGSGGIRAVGRLAPGVSAASARDELARLSSEMRLANPLWTPVEGYRAAATVVPLRDALVSDSRGRLLLLLGAVGLVLLTACANVANLLVARGLARERELAVRAALGASRGRVTRQLLTESLVLAALGGVGGIALAVLGTSLLRSWLPADTPRLAELGVDGRVLAASAAVTLLTAVLFGLAPALQGARSQVNDRLRQGGRNAGVGGGRRSLSRGLVVVQVALSVVLLSTAGLLLRSLDRLLAVDPGFRTERLVSARVSPPTLAYAGADRRRDLYRDVVERVGALPGVLAAEATSQLPFGGEPTGMALFLEDRTADPNDLPMFEHRRVTPGFLDLLGVPVLEGRPLSDADAAGSPLVGLVDQEAARRFWPGESPVGTRVRYPWRGAPWIEVVGVVAGVRDADLATAPGPALYVPFVQDPVPYMTLVVRSRGAADAIVADLRREVAAVDPAVAVSHVSTVEALVRGSVADARATAVLLAVFASLALLLVGVGLYGVLAWAARRRAREMGVRLVLGAAPSSVVGLVLRDGMALTGLGLALGLSATPLVGRALRGMLFEVAPADPLVLGGVAALLASLALVASWLPARRAASVEPTVALREE